MVTYKIAATVLSAAILAACAPSPYQAALADDLRAGRIVCEYEAPLGSNIRRKTCRLVDDLTRDEKEDIMRTFEQRPKIEGYGKP
jgi:hypothetical protein